MKIKKLPTFVLDVLVVVFGVLLALGIDQYRTSLKDEQIERDYLQALRSDLQSDLDQFDEDIYPEINARLEAAERLLAISEDNLPVDVSSQARFYEDIGQSGFMRIYQPRKTALEDLLATGNLRNITNFELRLSILNYYEKAKNWQPYDEWARELIWARYRDEATAFIALPFVKAYAAGELADEQSIRQTLNSEIFQRGLRNAIQLAKYQDLKYHQFEKSIEKIIADINKELGLED